MNTADQQKWQHMPLMAYDVESTGVSVWDDRIVTACVVEFHPGKRPAATTWLINPGIEIPAEAEAVHGISTAYAAEHGQDPAEALYEISGRLAVWMGRRFPVVAMNAAFDFSMTESRTAATACPRWLSGSLRSRSVR
jgi:DNA polymerase-3 subunit epsilon